MGQAKRRGTFEERKAAAIERNKVIEETLHEMGPRFEAYANVHGVQRLATRLAVSGVIAGAFLPPVSPPKK